MFPTSVPLQSMITLVCKNICVGCTRIAFNVCQPLSVRSDLLRLLLLKIFNTFLSKCVIIMDIAKCSAGDAKERRNSVPLT